MPEICDFESFRLLHSHSTPCVAFKCERMPAHRGLMRAVSFSQQEADMYMKVYEKARAKYQGILHFDAQHVSRHLLSIMSLLGPLRTMCSGGALRERVGPLGFTSLLPFCGQPHLAKAKLSGACPTCCMLTAVIRNSEHSHRMPSAAALLQVQRSIQLHLSAFSFSSGWGTLCRISGCLIWSTAWRRWG